MCCTTKNSETQTAFGAALEYAEQGRRVLPCSEAKRPLIKGWPEKATTDTDKVREWWTKWHHANVGVATGEASELLVLDIDIKGDGNGFVELEAFLGHPVEDIEAPRYSTPSGGQQIWFVYPVGDDDGIRTKAHIGGLSIDTRANGGFCVCPRPQPPPGATSGLSSLRNSMSCRNAHRTCSNF